MTALPLLRDAGGMAGESEDVLIALLHRFHERHLDAGGVLCRYGEGPTALWLIVAGRVASARPDAAGGQLALPDIGPGHLLGHVGVYAHGPRMVTCRAATPLDLLELDAAAAEALLIEPGPVGSAWRRLLGYALCEQISVTELAFLRVAARVAATPRT